MLWLVPEVVASLHEVFRDWEEDQFVAVLPELRLAFADLTPRECDHVARCVAESAGEPGAVALLAAVELEGFNEQDLLRGLAVNRQVLDVLRRTAWRTTMADDLDRQALLRWRMVLGKFSERSLGAPGGQDAPMPGQGPGGSGAPDRGGQSGSARYGRMDRALDYLYGREYGKRGVRDRQSNDRTGTPGASVLAIPDWLKEVRELFPRETVEVLERHALERYGMTELVTDADVLNKMEPNYELLKAVLSFRHLMAPKVLEVARKLVRQVVEDLRKRLAQRGSARCSGAGSTGSGVAHSRLPATLTGTARSAPISSTTTATASG